jgi:serine protease
MVTIARGVGEGATAIAVADGPADNQPTSPAIAVHTLLGDDVLMALGEKQGHGDAGRVPVAVLTPAPAWRPRPARDGDAAGRPVIALVDTGVEHHPWLDGSPSPDDPIVLHAEERGWHPPHDLPASPLFRGHATFLAGVIRQMAADCRILSVKLMGNDGSVQGTDSLRALDWLAAEAESGDRDRFVDVVCLAYGYAPNSDGTGSDGTGSDDAGHTADLRAALERLVRAGVLIVASAGNGGTDAKTYPAAFAAEPALSAAVVSVGATNPGGSYAHYSNWGGWVTFQAVGSGVISTMPSFNGPLHSPGQSSYPDAKGVTIDPDNFRDGFARWSGTSFSAATIAGLLGRALSDDAAAGNRAERISRALAAIEPYRNRHEYRS